MLIVSDAATAAKQCGRAAARANMLAVAGYFQSEADCRTVVSACDE